ncbi:UNVERIFIED_CONTAM: hypothetical protein HDU68_010455 [Siphonaria sp. JEL0065]|nr:hypothetical protein HDU68_010455 [Siphonaria sp. JEL0065]
MDTAPAAEGLYSSATHLFASLPPPSLPSSRTIKPNPKYKHIAAKTINKRLSDQENTQTHKPRLSIYSEPSLSKARQSKGINHLYLELTSSPTLIGIEPDNSTDTTNTTTTTTATATNESKAEEQYRLLSQISANRAENETAHLLTTVADHENHLAEQVANHLKGMQNFMASKLHTGGVFVDGGLVSLNTADRLVEAEKAKQRQEAQRKREQQQHLMEMELELKAKIERQKKTGKGRRRLAVLDGGTGDVPVGFLTQRHDFRPVPSISKTSNKDPSRVYDSMSLYEMIAKDGLQYQESNPELEEQELDIMDALNNKLEAMKLQLCQTTDRLEEHKRKKEHPQEVLIEERPVQPISAKKPSSKFVKVDSSASLLSRGVSAAIVRRTSSRPGPRVPLEVAAIWKAKEEGKFDMEPEDAHPPLAVAAVDKPNSASTAVPKRLVPRRNANGADFVSFSDSSNILSLKQVLDAQNSKIDKLAEDVLGPFDHTRTIHSSAPEVPVEHASIAMSAEEIPISSTKLHAPTPEPEPLEFPTTLACSPTPSTYTTYHVSEPLRKCDPPPEPVIFSFPHTSARLLDARNRRINPSTSSEIIQPKLPTNPQSLLIQSKIHNISQPPTLSAVALASTSKVAEACMKQQFKMAPTLSLMENGGGGKPNPVVELPERRFVGSLEHVFGLSFEDLKKQGGDRVDGKNVSVSDSVLGLTGVKSKHARGVKNAIKYGRKVGEQR